MVAMGGRIKELDLAKLGEAELRELAILQQEELKRLLVQVSQLQKMIFGRRSEKARHIDPSGLLPFPDFAELYEQSKGDGQKESVEVQGHTRQRTKRRSEFPEHLPRKRTECTLPERARACPDCGTVREEIGETCTRELERIELSYVHEIVRKKYACRGCAGHVVVAPGIDRILEKGILGPGFLAQIIFERFGNHMPYARLEKKYAAEGLELSRSVLCTSTMRCAELLEPVFEAHKQQVLESLETSVLQADDTEVVLRDGPEKGRGKVHVWAYRDQKGGVFYTLSPTRSRDGPRDILAGRSGRLQCDGHECFSDLGEGIQRIGCWAHARRKFVKAKDIGDELAEEPIRLIRALFIIEREGKALPPGELLALRQEKSKPVIEKLKAWMDWMLVSQAGLPRGPLMEAVGYTLNQWKTLIRFLDDGEIRDLTNNGCERALRGVVVGRKNWLFFGSEEGAKNSAVLMSLVQSCKELGLNPLVYVRDVLRAISTTPASKVGDLTPMGFKRRHQEKVGLMVDVTATEAVLRQLSYPS